MTHTASRGHIRVVKARMPVSGTANAKKNCSSLFRYNSKLINISWRTLARGKQETTVCRALKQPALAW